MNAIKLESGKVVEYRDGYITPSGMEIIVDDDTLSTIEKREFRKEIRYDQGTLNHLIFFGPTHSLFHYILN